MPTNLHTWQMVRSGVASAEPPVGGCLESKCLSLPEVGTDAVVIEISGCGVCGTDIGFYYKGVPTVVGAPLTLGHEISGVVVAGQKQWIGKEVIVPAILPCGTCDLCKSNRGNRCLSQKMPGNSLGIYGGFSSHILVPSRYLCEVPQHDGFSLADLAVVADAVATPYQAARRAELGEGDRVIIIGVTGGLGVYMAQWARRMGAAVVFGIGKGQIKVERALEYGCDFTIDAAGKSNREVQQAFLAFCRGKKVNPRYGWKIFEMSGTRSGQELALELLRYTGMLVIVGYTTETISYPISRLSPFDAEIRGSWGCLPEYIPLVLEEVLNGNIQITPFVQQRPMSLIKETFQEFYQRGSPSKRVVLVPDF